MKKPDFEKVLKQDVEESPSWFSQVLEPLNRLFEYIKEAFDSNISVQNLKVQVITLRSSGLVGFPPVYPLAVVKKTRKGTIIAIIVATIFRDDGQVWDSLNTVIWHQDGENIFIDNVQGVAGPLLNIRLLALYE
jgi:hypothetical protein